MDKVTKAVSCLCGLYFSNMLGMVVDLCSKAWLEAFVAASQITLRGTEENNRHDNRFRESINGSSKCDSGKQA